MSDAPPGGRSRYIHGSRPEEQERLSLLNTLLNESSARSLELTPGDSVLDVGCGLGQLSREIARRVRPGGRVVAIERDPEQLAAARARARQDGEETLVEFRRGSVEELPLADTEAAGFDVVHCRFVLEHLRDPAAAVRAMVAAARPGGRIVLEDDDHELLRLYPEAPVVDCLWRAYAATYEQLGNDPWVGRRLTGLLLQAGATPRRTAMPFFGSCAGQPTFAAMVANFRGVLAGARPLLVELGGWSAAEIDRALAAFDAWCTRPDAALWYVTCWAEGTKPR